MLNNPEQCIENLNLLGVTGIALRQGIAGPCKVAAFPTSETHWRLAMRVWMKL